MRVLDLNRFKGEGGRACEPGASDSSSGDWGFVTREVSMAPSLSQGNALLQRTGDCCVFDTLASACMATAWIRSGAQPLGKVFPLV